jgi:hypothetical protein
MGGVNKMNEQNESRKARREYIAAESHPLDTAENRQRHIHMVTMEAGRVGFNRGLKVGFWIGALLTAVCIVVGLLIF